MNDFNMEDYADLAETGFESKEATKPEDEFFHSVYIAGQNRKNHIGIEELAGKLQVRGFEYNLDEVNMIITNVKDLLVKVKTLNSKESLECASYKQGQPPWFGSSKLPNGSSRECGVTSAERAANEYCSACRAQILVSGIYCDPQGKPVVDEEKKPVFIFIRGKGMKYNNVSTYLGELYKMDLDPIFTPVTDESTKFEKAVVNNKRFVTKLTIGEAPSAYGPKKVFEFQNTTQIPKETVLSILKVAKKTIGKFNEKFDWSKKAGAVSGYGEQKQAQGVLTLDDAPPSDDQQSPAKDTPVEEKKDGGAAFDFSSLEF